MLLCMPSNPLHNPVQESHGSEIRRLAFNHITSGCGNLLASLAKDQVGTERLTRPSRSCLKNAAAIGRGCNWPATDNQAYQELKTLSVSRCRDVFTMTWWPSCYCRPQPSRSSSCLLLALHASSPRPSL
jgi:hypothetical protein